MYDALKGIYSIYLLYVWVCTCSLQENEFICIAYYELVILYRWKLFTVKLHFFLTNTHVYLINIKQNIYIYIYATISLIWFFIIIKLGKNWFILFVYFFFHFLLTLQWPWWGHVILNPPLNFKQRMPLNNIYSCPGNSRVRLLSEIKSYESPCDEFMSVWMVFK